MQSFIDNYIANFIIDAVYYYAEVVDRMNLVYISQKACQQRAKPSADNNNCKPTIVGDVIASDFLVYFSTVKGKILSERRRFSLDEEGRL